MIPVHAEPENLIYYLFTKKPEKLEAEIIKEKHFSDKTGKFRIAIIGSSHFFTMENCFTEILSCTNEQTPSENLLCRKSFNKNVSFSDTIGKCKYQFDAKTKLFENKQEYIKFEQEIVKSKPDLIHFFEAQTALTAIDFGTYKESAELKTWHGYPDFNKMIISKTVISRAANLDKV